MMLQLLLKKCPEEPYNTLEPGCRIVIKMKVDNLDVVFKTKKSELLIFETKNGSVL